MKAIPIILDCDPGHDDAIAIMVAAKHPAIDLKGITVVAGNQTQDKTVTNALNVVQALDLDVPVYAGASEALVREDQFIADSVHGDSGLDGPVFDPLKIQVQDQHAVLYMIDTLLAAEEPITVVATGPLTNVALALKLCPKIKDHIKEFVIMGGSYQHGNLTPAAEFNIYADPEAAAVVFHSGILVTMVGLDVSRQTLTYPEIVDRMARHDNRAGRLFKDLLGFFNQAQHNVFGWDGAPLHDPITIAYLIDPRVLEVKRMHVDVDTWSHQSYGRTNCDVFGLSDRPKNADVAMGVDVDKFWQIIEDSIALYDN